MGRTPAMHQILRAQRFNPVRKPRRLPICRAAGFTLHRTLTTAPHSDSASRTASIETNKAKQNTEDAMRLPEPTDNGTAIKISVQGGEGVKLDHLGPMVVNRDGTLSRISNWSQMTEMERQNTLRILGKRNQLRLDVLKCGNGATSTAT